MSAAVWFICLAGLLAVYLLEPSAAGLGALLLFGAAPGVSWLWLLPRRKKLGIALTAPGVTGKGKPVELAVTLTGMKKLPAGKTVVRLRVKNTVTEEVLKKRLSFRQRGQYWLRSAYCGGLECGVASVWVYDLFGVLPMPVPCRGEKRIVVMPDTFPVETERGLRFSRAEDCTEYAPDKKGQDPSETFQIREYVPGDSPRQIHWKLSGKLDKLIVREASCPVDHTLLVFLDKTSEVLGPQAADALLEAVTSVCQGLAAAGQPFRLAWNEETVRLYDIAGEEQLPEAISAMLKAPRAAGAPGAWLYQRTYGCNGRVLYFCAQLPPTADAFPEEDTLTFLCGAQGDGEGMVTFSPQDMRDTLRTLSWS